VAAPILKYPGSKWRMAARIVAGLPVHTTYVEPFFGSGAVFFTKAASALETINDRDGDVVNLFRAVRDHPAQLAYALDLTPWARAEWARCWEDPHAGDVVEDARRYLVRVWQNYGSITHHRKGWRHTTDRTMRPLTEQWDRLPERVAAVTGRLKEAQIECTTALDIIARYDDPTTLLYVDPPYPLSTRGLTLYRHELTDDDHRALLDALDAHPGPVVLSGYACPLYDDRLGHWQREEIAATAEGGRARTEIVWRNERAARPRLFA
jgi:DNA adenine methylase